MTRVLLLQAHPDTASPHLCHALAGAYAEGARAAGHDVRTVDVGALDFPLLRSQESWEKEPLPASLQPAQQAIRWAEHIVIFYPLWLGDMPALLKGFLEQVARPGFAFAAGERNALTHKGLAGRSARIVVTMGMPGFVYRWFFRAHSLKSLKRNVLQFLGITPVRDTVIGGVGRLRPERAVKWMERLRAMGQRAA